MKVIVCGSRHWRDLFPIRDRLARLPKDAVIIQGGQMSRDKDTGECWGADFLAKTAAALLGLRSVEEKADWDKYKLQAGPIRNAKMLGLEPDLVIAFHEDPHLGKGTRHMVSISRAAGVPVEIYSS